MNEKRGMNCERDFNLCCSSSHKQVNEIFNFKMLLDMLHSLLLSLFVVIVDNVHSIVGFS